MEQGTEEWKKERLGKVTASRLADVMARTKSGWSASRANYAAQLIVARLTGVHGETFTNAAMQWGIDTEPKARIMYELMTDNAVSQIAYVNHPTIKMSGCSPDGLIGPDGLIEIKCPNTSTHIDFLLGEPIDDKYMKQMQWQMACTERAWCDFVSFDPRMPAKMQMKIVRVPRDDLLIHDYGVAVEAFLAEIDAKIERLRSAA
jgi:putative phage-type endonuclease